MFSVILWIFEDYIPYAITIIVLSLISVIVAIIETRSNLARIRKMADYSCTVKVLRNGKDNPTTDLNSTDLVPGDIIEIPEMMVMPCDFVLMTGSCIVNESMLTGESIPVIKNAIPFTNDIYDPQSDSKYTLYAGTKVIQNRMINNQKVYGLVIRTGFITTKGGLVRDILYPKPNKF